MARTVVGLVAFVVAVLTHGVALGWFLLGTCAVSDVAVRVPAPASVQGLICDRQDHWLNATPFVVLGGSALLAVVLAVAWWDSRRRWLGLTAAVWLAAISTVVLAAPSDTCSASVRESESASACSTRGNG